MFVDKLGFAENSGGEGGGVVGGLSVQKRQREFKKAWKRGNQAHTKLRSYR